MTFQALDYKGNYFLNLLNDNYLPIKPTYMKGDTWFKLMGYFNSLCVRVTRAITKHTPISEYHLRFFSKVSSSQTVDLVFLYFHSYFSFSFQFIFYFFYF